MKKQIKIIVCLLLTLSFVLGMATIAPVRMFDAGTYNKAALFRIAGVDRFDTANKIAKAGWSSSHKVYLASADSYADALAGVPLAHIDNAPILLVRGKSVPKSVMDTIYNLGATSVTILGGTAAVSQEIEDELEEKNFFVHRIAGKNRYDTAWQIAHIILLCSDLPLSEMFIVSGENYPDALSIGPIAALKGAPIIYSNAKGAKGFNNIYAVSYGDGSYSYGSSLEDTDWIEHAINERGGTAIHLSDIVNKVTIIGGEAAVGKNAMDELNNSGFESIERIYGASRYETSLMVTERYSDVFETKGLAFATGENFPDALAGGVFAAKKSMPVILLNPKTKASQSSYIGINAMAYDSSRDYTENLVGFINKFKPEEVYTFGGESVIPDSVICSYFEGDINSFQTLDCSVSLVDMYKGTDYSNVSFSIYNGTLTHCKRGEEDITISDGEYRYFKVTNGTGELEIKVVPDENGACSVKLPKGEYTVIASCSNSYGGYLYVPENNKYYDSLYGHRYSWKWSSITNIELSDEFINTIDVTLGKVTPL